MVQQFTVCPKHWKKGCHSHPCDTPVTPLPLPPQPTQVHNIVYLVDEHNIAKDVKQTVVRNGPTLQKRYAWHHQVANLSIFNIGDVPGTIELHEKIGNRAANPNFSWEGFMLVNIPGGNAACRVTVVAGADKAGDATFTGPGGTGGASIDRVVGFAGIYPDNNVPLGPIVQVRRNDAYRFMGASLNGPVKAVWRCAYYITKDTPKQPTTPAKSPLSGFSLLSEGNPDEASVTDQAPDGQDSGTTLTYDQILDQNIDDDVAITRSGDSWGGMILGFTTDGIPNTAADDDTALRAYDDSAINELKGQ